MGSASGILKQVKYKAEVSFGTVPAAAGAQLLRRVTSGIEFSKDTYQSNEIRSDYQMADYRHGIRRVSGPISGELSPKTYADFFAAALKKDFAATAAITGASITVGGVAGAWTITRATGSFLTDGVKQGDVIRLTAGTFNANNLNKNLLVYTVTATILTCLVLNGTALTTEGPIASATVTVVGKKSFTPTTGHTDKSFSIEEWYPDVPTSEVFSGCKVTKASIQLPATGIATVSFDFVGKDITTSTTEFFTSPTAITTTGALAAVNGVIRFASGTVVSLTGLNVDITCGQDGQPTVGSNTIAALIAQRVIASGQATGIFDTTTFRDAFVNETEVSLIAAFTTDNTAGADFIAINIPRAKLTQSTRDDGEKTIVATYGFQALFNSAGGAGTATDQTTIVIQDSQA